MKCRVRKKQSERGELLLESLIVYLVTICLLFFILAIFSILFQRWNIQVIANETASRVAQTYKYIDVESTGYVTETQIGEVRAYRYIWKKDELETVADKKAKEHAKGRLSKTTFTKNVTEPVVNVVVVSDSLARRHVEVTVTGEYKVPFGEIMSFFGLPGTTTYEVKAYAECLDITDYIGTVNYVKCQTSLGVLGSKTIELVDAILGLVDNLLGD